MSILKDSVTPIESILDNMDFTYNEHILKNAEKIKEQEKDFICAFLDWVKQEYELEDTSHWNKWRDVNGEYKTSKELLTIFLGL